MGKNQRRQRSKKDPVLEKIKKEAWYLNRLAMTKPKDVPWLSPEQNQRIWNRNDREFLKVIAQEGVPLNKEQEHALCVKVYPHMENWKKDALERKVRQKLQQPRIKDAIAEIYGMVADFHTSDAIRMHVGHIKNGNYQALKDYMKMAMPEPARQVNVRQESVNIHVKTNEIPQQRIGPPPTRARAIDHDEPLPLPSPKKVREV